MPEETDGKEKEPCSSLILSYGINRIEFDSVRFSKKEKDRVKIVCMSVSRVILN